MIDIIFIMFQYIFINVKIISELFKILYRNTPFIISILIEIKIILINSIYDYIVFMVEALSLIIPVPFVSSSSSSLGGIPLC